MRDRLPALGTARLLTFAVRALALLLLLSLLWLGAAQRYNHVLVWTASPLLPDDLSVRVLGAHILFQPRATASPVSIDGFTLHYGLILMAVIVLAAVGVSAFPRAVWLAAMAAGAFIIHVSGVALLAWGVAWAFDAASPDDAGQAVFSLFAVLWGMLPAVAALAWYWLYWLPRAGKDEDCVSL